MTESMKSGVLLSAEGRLPRTQGARVRLSRGKITVAEGAFAETKDSISGFALIQANSKPEAIEYAQRFLKIAGDGESEIRQLFEADNASRKP